MSTIVLAPMTLGDIFDRLFKLIGKTWLKNLIVAGMFLVPAGLIMGIAADIGSSQLADMLRDRDLTEQWSSEEFSTLLGFAAWFGVGALLLSLGSVAATVSITVLSCSEMSGEPLSWQEALSRTFYSRLLKVIGQSILEGLLIGAMIVIPYVLIIIGIAADSIALGFLGGVLLMASLGGAIYLGISFAFCVPIIAWEDANIFEAFKRSWQLVRNHWWRTFGILILMSIMVSFAVSIIMTPFYLLAFWDFFKGYFHMIESIANGEPDASFVVEMVRSLGFGLGVVSGIASIVELLVTPLYSVVMYFDLRARHGEFAAPSAPAQSPAV